jgi:hypothetical protein
MCEACRLTPIDKILAILAEEDFLVRHVINPQSSRLESLFFAHPEMVSIYRENRDVLMLDCTYCMNKYKLPLLCIYFFTRTGQVLPLAHALLDKETQDGYAWALRALEQRFEPQHVDQPSVVLHDCDRALIYALEVALPNVKHMLYMWHKRIRVEAQAAKDLGRVKNDAGRCEISEAARESMCLYNDCINALSEEDFDTAY